MSFAVAGNRNKIFWLSSSSLRTTDYAVLSFAVLCGICNAGGRGSVFQCAPFPASN